MTDQHYALFDTPIGICGIEWGPRGINGLQLPMGSDEKTRARIRQRHGDISETAPTEEEIAETRDVRSHRQTARG